MSTNTTPAARPAPAAPLFREAAEEARVLFDCLRALAGDALAAAERGDEDTLLRALGERDGVSEWLAPLVRELGRVRSEAGGSGQVESEAAEVVCAALAVQEDEALLAARLEEIRAAVAVELARRGLAGGAAARA
ncbi:MAG TPA: hypothetical protein VHG51_05685, partial [Longimicrobiaceae bacterium]|nr:hypothetical protein [Longimicrobiaceae bacterium]